MGVIKGNTRSSDCGSYEIGPVASWGLGFRVQCLRFTV